MMRIIECVPNFSEGRDMEKINSIVESIEKSGGVKVLDVDPGEATNRTVVTFVGSPEAVVEAAFQGVRRAAELIDMRQHHGAHPRSGAAIPGTDSEWVLHSSKDAPPALPCPGPCPGFSFSAELRRLRPEFPQRTDSFPHSPP